MRQTVPFWKGLFSDIAGHWEPSLLIRWEMEVISTGPSGEDRELRLQSNISVTESCRGGAVPRCLTVWGRRQDRIQELVGRRPGLAGPRKDGRTSGTPERSTGVHWGLKASRIPVHWAVELGCGELSPEPGLPPGKCRQMDCRELCLWHF